MGSNLLSQIASFLPSFLPRYLSRAQPAPGTGSGPGEMVLVLPELIPTRRNRLRGGRWYVENMAARGVPLREVRGELPGN